MAQYFIGTSGWHYEDWQGRFYPDSLPREKWLEFYACRFHTVELNNSFYRLPSDNAFTNWYQLSPPDFTFAVKVSRYITHIKRLRDTGEAVGKFMDRAKILKEKLGPLLYQLPPGLHRHDEILDSFLAGLPRGFKHVIEFRHQSWLVADVFAILRRHSVGFCVFDMPSFTCPLVATAGFAYIRFHGSNSLYSSDYSDQELTDWAKRICDIASDLESVYIYFNNDVSGFALKNALTIRDYLEKSGKRLGRG